MPHAPLLPPRYPAARLNRLIRALTHSAAAPSADLPATLAQSESRHVHREGLVLAEIECKEEARKYAALARHFQERATALEAALVNFDLAGRPALRIVGDE